MVFSLLIQPVLQIKRKLHDIYYNIIYVTYILSLAFGNLVSLTMCSWSEPSHEHMGGFKCEEK